MENLVSQKIKHHTGLMEVPQFRESEKKSFWVRSAQGSMSGIDRYGKRQVW